MRSNLIYCAVLGVLLSSLSNAVDFKFSNFVCESYNKSWFVFHECRLKAVSRTKVILNMNGTVLHSVNNIHIKAKIFKRESGFKPWLLETEVDGCRFIRKSYNPIFKIIFDLFKDFTNFNHTCPYVGPQLVRGFYLRPELLRLPFPTGEYMLTLRWLFDRKLQFDTNGTILVRGFYLRPELLRFPFPTGELSLKMIFDQKPQIDTNISFVFVEDLRQA